MSYVLYLVEILAPSAIGGATGCAIVLIRNKRPPSGSHE